MTLTTYPALWSIQFYQRFISPYKGFRCAHATLHKGDSCSQAIKKIILEQGVWNSKTLIKARFAQCRLAAQTLQLARLEDSYTKRERKQRRCGYTTQDCGCDIADLGCDIVQNSGSCDSKMKTPDCVPDCGCGF
jgi:putative component of membrane protein insertase Oxa1/YidC/SpoIIIJ protein YidD